MPSSSSPTSRASPIRAIPQPSRAFPTTVRGYPKFDAGRVRINPDQYFDAVPAIAWAFHIGGYQPAQKWLKDRRGRTLSWDDIGHYQRIVKILAETDRVMRLIDLPLD